MTSYLVSAFASSQKCFDALVKDLMGHQTAQLDAASIEERIRAVSHELLRQIMQDYLDLRTTREEKTIVPMRAKSGELHSQTTKTSRVLGTIFGDVTVSRKTLRKRGTAGGLRPMDAELNLPLGKYSFGVVRRLAWLVATSSYTTALEHLKLDTAAQIARRQAQELIGSVVVDFESFYLDCEHEPVDDNAVLVLSFDGSGVIMRPEGLREETRKRATDSRRRSTAETSASVGRLSTQKNRKRMAEVATTYDIESQPRTPQDILSRLRSPGPHPPRPKAQNKRVWASLSRSVYDVINEAFAEAKMRDPEQTRHWVVLLDGNKHQLDTVLRIAKNAEITVTVIIDFIHVLGYLWKAGKALVGPDAADIEEWVELRSQRLLQGKIQGIAGGMRHSATTKALKGKAREAVDTCANYLLKYQSYLCYDVYLHDGLPIATGVIEGACRSLVKDRMDITGARWGLDGGEAVLAVRSLRASGDLEDYLSFHAQRELERNHLSKFHEGELVELRTAKAHTPQGQPQPLMQIHQAELQGLHGNNQEDPFLTGMNALREAA